MQTQMRSRTFVLTDEQFEQPEEGDNAVYARFYIPTWDAKTIKEHPFQLPDLAIHYFSQGLINRMAGLYVISGTSWFVSEGPRSMDSLVAESLKNVVETTRPTVIEDRFTQERNRQLLAEVKNCWNEQGSEYLSDLIVEVNCNEKSN